MSDFAFHPELFERREQAIEVLARRGFHWLEHFSSVDLLQDLFGLEVCGITEKRDAERILVILEELFPEWMRSGLCYHPYERDHGWKAIICQRDEEDETAQGD